MKRRRRLTITKVRRQIVTRTTTSLFVRCPVCQRHVETLSIMEAGAILQLAGRIIDVAIASGHIHVISVLDGSSLVCKDSLFAI